MGLIANYYTTFVSTLRSILPGVSGPSPLGTLEQRRLPKRKREVDIL